MHTVGQQIDVVQRFLARVPRLVPDFETAQPFHTRHALHAGHQQAQRIAVLRTQHFAVLPIDDHYIGERKLHRDRACQRRAVGAFRQYELAFRTIKPCLVEQRGQQHARELAARDHAVRVLHRRHGHIGPLHAAVGTALDEVNTRNRRKPHHIVHRQHQRTLDQAMNHQSMLLGVNLWHTGVMPLEVHAARRDNAEQILQRSEADAGLRLRRETWTLTPLHIRLVLRGHAVAGGHHRRAERTCPRRNKRCAGRLRSGAGARDQGTRRHATEKKVSALQAEQRLRQMILRRCNDACGAHTFHARCIKRFSVRFDTEFSSTWLAICTHAVRHSVTMFGSAIE